MLKIQPTYQINRNTQAILPVRAIDYQALIREKMQEVYVKQTPLAIIKANCLDGGASYQGRRSSAVHLLGSANKVPILIYDRAQIYAFPTQSPTNFDCIWLFAQHILKINKQLQPDNPSLTSRITFRNSTTFDLKESSYLLQKQLNRTIQLHYAIKYSNLVEI